jgi:hypothetical protein
MKDLRKQKRSKGEIKMETDPGETFRPRRKRGPSPATPRPRNGTLLPSPLADRWDPPASRLPPRTGFLAGDVTAQ